MLFLQAVFMLVAYDVLTAACSFHVLYSTVKSWKVASGGPVGQNTINNVCVAVNYACVWYPKRALCLQRSFTTAYLLRKYGVDAHMVLGARKLPFRAHAWVEVGGQPINERANVETAYAVWDRC